MVKNYFKIALRNLLKNKGISFINIAGLAIAITCCILIFLFVHTETSYDIQHSKSGRIFRVLTIDKALGVSSNLVGVTLPALGPAMKAEFPEITGQVRVSRSGKNLIEYNQKYLYTTDLIYAEPELFKVFDYNVIEGDKNTALTRPNTAVLTKSISQKLFGNEGPVGKVFKVDNNTEFEVTAVMEDVPAASHLAMDVVLSLLPAKSDTNLAQYLNSWNNISMSTYVVLNNAASEKAVESKLEPLLRKNNVGKNFNVTLQPLKDVHLGSSEILFDDANKDKSDYEYVYSLLAVALFIILIASFNFMNLSTARASNRAREVGLRKVVGANRFQLMSQYLSESVLVCFAALFLALILVEVFAPRLDLPVQDSFILYLFKNPVFTSGIIAGTLFLGLLSGTYPAMVLSGFRPAKVLKGSVKNSKGGIWLRRVLVVIQFTASIAMIVGTFVVYQQLDFIRNKNAGYNREQVLTINLNDQQLLQRDESLKNEMKKITGVSGASLSSTLPGRGFGRTGILPEGKDNRQDIWIVSIMSADEDFIPNMGIKLSEGRNFSKDYPSDLQQGLIINEAMAKALEWKEPLGKKINAGQNNFNIVGVVKDFHYTSMRHKIEPLMIINSPNILNTLSVKIKPGSLNETITQVQSVWKRINPNYPFEYTFLDDEFEQLYKTEQSFAGLIINFTWLAIFIACLGLFGLAAYTVEQKTKEIGIRKVLGASVPGIIMLLTKEFAKLVFIACLVAVPVSYYFMNDWLKDFAYRISLAPWVFIAASVLALSVAVLTVGYQALKAAWINPAKSLMYE
jgi:putative ABC transport system permease protein